MFLRFSLISTVCRIRYGLYSCTNSLRRISEIPGAVNRTYIDQAPYWLTYFPCVHSFFSLPVNDSPNIYHCFDIQFERVPRSVRLGSNHQPCFDLDQDSVRTSFHDHALIGED